MFAPFLLVTVSNKKYRRLNSEQKAMESMKRSARHYNNGILKFNTDNSRDEKDNSVFM